MKTRSKSLQGNAIIAMIALIAGMIFFGGITPASATTYTVCPNGYVVSGTNCTLTTTYQASGNLTVEVLVVAGGANGATGNGGAGGAGGQVVYSSDTYTGNENVIVGTSASNSSVSGVVATAGGGAIGGNGWADGSGNGGAGSSGNNSYSVWASATSTGVNGYYAGGGGGGGYYPTCGSGYAGGAGGAGGGGAGGGYQTQTAGNPGVPNTGGGGGGGGCNQVGGAGGSGLILIRYSGVVAKASGGVISNDGSYTYHKFLSNSTFVLTDLNVCNVGDSLSGSTCTNVVTIAGTIASDRCPVGSHEDPLDVSKCILDGGSISAGSTVTPSYSCPDGYALTYLLGATVPICQTAGTTYLATVNTTKSCPSGGTLINDNCVTDSTYISQNYTATTTTIRTCPNGGTLAGDTCYVTGGAIVRAYQGTSYGVASGYYCSGQDFLAGDTCYTTGGALLSSYTATTTLIWACPDGYFPYFSDCWNGYQTASHYYITSVTCPSGGTLSGTTCNVYSVSTSYSAFVTYTTTYYCPEGGEISGTTCTLYAQPTSYLATIQSGTSTCPNGGTLSGTTCINGYTQSGQTYPAIVTTNYSCPNGGTLTNLNCVYQTTTITIIIKYSGSCPTNYKFNSETLLCDPVPYPYVAGTIIPLAGVYLCLTYSYGNLIETKYFTYDATNSTVLGSLFERKCVLESGLEANVSSESGFYYCEIINKVTQEMTTLLSPTDITGFRNNKSTTCILRDDVSEPDLDIYVFDYNQSLIDTCASVDNVPALFAVWIACQIIRNT